MYRIVLTQFKTNSHLLFQILINKRHIHNGIIHKCCIQFQRIISHGEKHFEQLKTLNIRLRQNQQHFDHGMT